MLRSRRECAWKRIGDLLEMDGDCELQVGLVGSACRDRDREAGATVF